jgi:hypothetical protein
MKDLACQIGGLLRRFLCGKNRLLFHQELDPYEPGF